MLSQVARLGYHNTFRSFFPLATVEDCKVACTSLERRSGG